jgi:hypothetical protein
MRGIACALLVLCCTTARAVDLKPPSSAELCGDCHRAIYDGWKKSAHASAMESRLFQDALKLAESDFGAQARKNCLTCHAPVAVLTGDFELVKKVSWEGVTCDYCHSIQEVTTAGGKPKAKVEFTVVKSGPSKDLFSPAHGTRFSPLHTSSLACVACHEYTNSQGFPVLATYSEWKDSTYGKGEQGCQGCHMFRVEGDVVDPRIVRAATLTLNLHEISGGHSIQQLNKAIKADLSTSREGDQLRVTVKLTNRGAGHYVPTGSALRQLILDLEADSLAGQHFSEQRTYRRTVADRGGVVLNREDLVFVKGVRVVADTRLAPNETKTETFSFPLPRGTQTRVKASLYYYYSPLATTEAQQKVKFLELTRLAQ